MDLRNEIKEMMVENLMLKVPKEEIGDALPLFGAEGLGLDPLRLASAGRAADPLQASPSWVWAQVPPSALYSHG